MTTRSLADSIRPLKARRELTLPKRTPPGRSLPALFVRERLETRILPYLETLREAIPLAEPHRRLYDGAWVLGLAANLPYGTYKGELYEAFSRIEFTLRMDVEHGEYSVAARSTVFDHDLPTEQISGRFDESTRAVEEFVERLCLRFARSFLDASPRSLKRDLQERDLLYRNRKPGQ
jgi:hypothetical protein